MFKGEEIEGTSLSRKLVMISEELACKRTINCRFTNVVE